MLIDCYTTVSDLAICQRCPALFAYKFHKKEKSAWRVGIKGTEAYGSIFHREISQKFFEAASNPRSPIYKDIAKATDARQFENLIRENFFIPFVEHKGKFLTASQILAMARAVRVWIRGIMLFFGDSKPIFIKPEGKLSGNFESDGTNLIINGRYDALIFNPDKVEARLFEFKGFRKSDITVPLSQSLIYSWLIEKATGIMPSIEIIYLDEEQPEIFDPKTVRAMIASGLPGLFRSAVDIILLRRLPIIMSDKNLCESCKFQATCKKDMEKIFSPKFKFRKRRGASMMSLLVFFFAAMVIMAQVFFFSNVSSESVKEDRDIQSVRMQLESLVNYAENLLKKNLVRENSKRQKDTTSPKGEGKITFYENLSTRDINYASFDDARGEMPQEFVNQNYNYSAGRDNFTLNVDKLDYEYKDENFKDTEWEKVSSMEKRIFPPMKDHFLIRAIRKMPAENNFMIQVLVQSTDTTFKTKTHEEIWY